MYEEKRVSRRPRERERKRNGKVALAFILFIMKPGISDDQGSRARDQDQGRNSRTLKVHVQLSAEHAATVLVGNAHLHRVRSLWCR